MYMELIKIEKMGRRTS